MNLRHEALGHRCAQVDAAAGHLLHRLHEFFGRAVLGHVAACAGLEAAQRVGRLAVHAQHEHGQLRVVDVQVLDQRHTAHAGHAQVGDDHVEGVFAQPLQGRLAAVGLLHRPAPCRGIEDAAQAFAHQLVVVHQQQAQPRRGHAGSGRSLDHRELPAARLRPSDVATVRGSTACTR
jgi:hypothetical protein